MPEFTSSWAFAFIVGIICFAVGFALAIIMAGGSRRSRAEEGLVGYKPPPKKLRRPNKPTPAPPLKIEIVTKNDPRTD